MSARRRQGLWVALVGWAMLGGGILLGKKLLFDDIHERAHGEKITWHSPHAMWLVCAAALVGFLAFHLYRRRIATMAYSQTRFVPSSGAFAYLSNLPGVMRGLAIAAIAAALARPETYRTLEEDVDSVDIMIVFDMSKSMETDDMTHNRMDAAQRVVRRFLRRNKSDRIGLVIFGQKAMVKCPLTHDSRMLEQIVAELTIGEVPALGTAIGDGLALGLAQLKKKSDAKSKIVILLSDGDSNTVAQLPDGNRGFYPEEAARLAQKLGVKVYTILVGREESDIFGGSTVNPETLRDIARTTGGEFFRATDYESFDRGFQTVRNKLDTTKRTIKKRVPDQELFVVFAVIAAMLIGLELVLSYGRLRRLP